MREARNGDRRAASGTAPLCPLVAEGAGLRAAPSLVARGFAGAARSVPEARAFVRELLTAWGFTAGADDVLVCVSELVSNAVRHAVPDGGSFLVRVGVTSTGLRIEVCDPSPLLPRVRRPDPAEVHGRGLLLVDTLAAGWGVERLNWGKVLWAELPCAAQGHTPPTVDLLRSVLVSTWIDTTPHGHVAFLLVAHPPSSDLQGGGSLDTERKMRGLAACLSLAPPSALLPDIEGRLTMSGRTEVLVSIVGCGHDLRVPVGTQWGGFAAAGGPVVVVVGLDPLPGGADRRAVSAYLAEGARSGRLLLGRACTGTLTAGDCPEPSASAGRERP